MNLFIIWSFLKKGNLFGLIGFYLHKARHRALQWLADHPLATLKALRFLPLLLGIAVVGSAGRFGDLSSPLAALTTCFFVALGIWLSAATVAVVSLAGPLLLPFMAAWRNGGWRILAFFVPAFAVAYGYRGNPQQQLLGLAACLLLWSMFYGLVEYLYDSMRWQRKRRLKRFSVGRDKLVLNDEEFWRICVHEAGHLLLYGQLQTLPEDAIAVADREPRYGFGGFVTPLHLSDAVEVTIEVLWWQATMAYAGAAAERCVFGAHCEGAAKDHEMADELIARIAALAHTAYFTKPANATQESANIMTICRLREECQRRADAYIALNQTQLVAIAEQLRRSECVNCEDFFPVWRTLLLPDGWRKLAVPDRIPCLDGQGRTSYEREAA